MSYGFETMSPAYFGVRPDQRLSSVYKLYRVSRTGPDSPIDSAAQIVFYDAGLGTEDATAGAPICFARWLFELLGSGNRRRLHRGRHPAPRAGAGITSRPAAARLAS